jgi:hypothetical protein
MEYLIQFQIVAKDLAHLEPIRIILNDIEVILYLHDKDLISKGKKSHFVLLENNKNEAYRKALINLDDLNRRLIFLFNERILFGHMEFIIENQIGNDVRNIFLRDLHLGDGHHYLNTNLIDFHMDFFNTRIDKSDIFAIGKYNEALQSDLPTEQFRALFLALERLSGCNTFEKRCGKCGALLNPRATNEQLDIFLQKANKNDIFLGREIPKARDFRRLRGRLSHVVDKTDSLTLAEINEKIRILSGLIRSHLEEKYKIMFTGGAIGGPLEYCYDYDAEFRTECPKEKFALDFPSLAELKNRTVNSRWLKIK